MGVEGVRAKATGAHYTRKVEPATATVKFGMK